MHNLRLILGDQLSTNLSALKGADPKTDIILMAELRNETDYVPHHKKKIAFLFAAMRHFAKVLQRLGFQVVYTKLDDPDNTHSFTGELLRVLQKNTQLQGVIATEPGEYRVLKMMQVWQKELRVPVELRPDTRFLASRDDFKNWATGRKQYRMEFFYRDMRKKYKILMTKSGEPEGGQWNYDAENRKPPKGGMVFPKRPQIKRGEIIKEVISLVEKTFANHFGDIEPFDYAVTHEAAEQSLIFFLDKCLPTFGDFQDAMMKDEAFLYHSVISMYLNCGLLDPLDVCKKAEARYYAGTAPLNAVEGFIRQVLGWREFIRGIYWLEMPGYAGLNALNATRPLPDFYWSAKTQMNCVANVVTQTRQHAYSHHIQRLMITGNFALLAGLDVKQVCEWYLAVYLDAYEWVELPNTLGMALHADSGIVGSKPYAASGKYIDRMSNFCKTCIYDPQEMLGDKACPFNSLYWHFLNRNAAHFSKNPRMTNMYATWNRMADDKKKAILKQAENFLEQL